MMIGGDKDAVEHLDPIFAALAPGIGTIERTPGREGRDPRVEQGYLYCGPAGAGHFVKMVHNGIEYGLMQAYAEGFDILRNVNSPAVPENRRYKLDLADIAEVWRRGSVVASWLLDLTAIALAEDADLKRVLRPRRGFGRGPLDDPGGDRRGGAGRGAVGGALHPLPLAPGPHLRREDPVGDAQAVRRPPGAAEGISPMDSAHDPSASRLGARAPGAALRDGHFRRQRRPDQAPLDAGALQPGAGAPAVGQLCGDRRRPLRVVGRGFSRASRRRRAQLRLGYRRTGSGAEAFDPDTWDVHRLAHEPYRRRRDQPRALSTASRSGSKRSKASTAPAAT